MERYQKLIETLVSHFLIVDWNKKHTVWRFRFCQLVAFILTYWWSYLTNVLENFILNIFGTPQSCIQPDNLMTCL